MRALGLDEGSAARPRMEPVESRAIAAIGYDAPSRTLSVRFHEGALYAYLEAPPMLFERFRAAESKGRFFQAEIDPALRFLRLA